MTTDAAIEYSRRFQWLTTSVNPRTVSHTADDGVRGWRQHAIEATADEQFGAVRDRKAACGLRAAHGWGLDMFVEKKCARCLRALGIACPRCRGTGRVEGDSNGSCLECFGRSQTPESLREDRERARIEAERFAQKRPRASQRSPR